MGSAQAIIYVSDVGSRPEGVTQTTLSLTTFQEPGQPAEVIGVKMGPTSVATNFKDDAEGGTPLLLPSYPQTDFLEELAKQAYHRINTEEIRLQHRGRPAVKFSYLDFPEIPTWCSLTVSLQVERPRR